MKNPTARRINRYIMFGLIACFLPPVKLLAQPAANPRSQDASCSTSRLPPALQKRLASDFATWKIQGSDDLSPSANARWASGDYKDCPGIASGEFREKNRQSFAVLLVPQDKPNSAYRLVFFTSSNDSSPEEFTVVDKSESAAAANFFLHGNRLDAIFDEASRGKFHITARDAVVFFDAGENEYEADAYYWADGAYHNASVDM